MKLLLILISSFLLLSATEMGLKGGSCTLAQVGKIQVVYATKLYENASYKANASSGKNFREIFVGSIIGIDKNIKLKIIDYKPNKRIKGKPKTGIFIVQTTLNDKKETIQMAYIFDKGSISATGVTKSAVVAFSTKVSYSFCTPPTK